MSTRKTSRLTVDQLMRLRYLATEAAGLYGDAIDCVHRGGKRSTQRFNESVMYANEKLTLCLELLTENGFDLIEKPEP